MSDEPGDPTPVEGLTLQTLQSLTQTVLCCNQPMRYLQGRTNWHGQHGTGTQIDRTERVCEHCAATLTTITHVPS
jgi:hypothetical protein